jgi:hypothetical protein
MEVACLLPLNAFPAQDLVQEFFRVRVVDLGESLVVVAKREFCSPFCISILNHSNPSGDIAVSLFPR